LSALRSLAVVLLLAATTLAGCADLFAGCPDHQIKSLSTTAWNRDNQFRVVAAGHTIHITASSPSGALDKTAAGDLGVVIPDGTWTIDYQIDGHTCNTFDGVRIDTLPPVFQHLDEVGTADASGNYVLGQGASVDGASQLQVVDLQDGSTVGTTLPVHLQDLPDGLQAFLVSARDEAGNYDNVTVQVHVGSAAQLPLGRYTFGVVARYTNAARLWELSDTSRYLSMADARAAVAGQDLGGGFDITPDDSAVKDVVAQTVQPGMNTMDAALALFKYFADNLRYDTSRLDSDTLLTPHQVLLDTEDAQGRDCTDPSGQAPDCDGIVMDGAGNGVRGGICRDLAATYVSLLRDAGVPARLVSGYIAGTVNGFHAWVEFYAGGVDGQSPWVPVDVSSIDGHYKPAILLQSFGIALPEYLALRDVPPAAEKPGWSAPLSVHYTWPQGSGQSAPEVDFEKNVTNQFTESGVLCFNPQTFARELAQAKESCAPPTYGFFLPDFTTKTERTIDYGVQVVQAPRGTSVTAQVAYPFPTDIAPDQVDYQFYGPAFSYDRDAGKAVATFSPSG